MSGSESLSTNSSSVSSILSVVSERRYNESMARLVALTTLLLLAALTVVAQEPPPESVRPLYGVQGVLVETLDGKVVSSQAENEQFNPASTMKLATALMALKTLGPEHRFATAVWTDGQLDRTTGALNGNLYVSGRDPSFHYEHAILLARELNMLGIKQVTGGLFVAPGFTMNFSGSAKGSGEQLHDTLDSTRRVGAAIQAWNYERTLLHDQAALQNLPS